MNQIKTTHLFPILEKELIDLLQSLSPDEWEAQTIAKAWKVKDVAAHLLDGNIRAISMLRDNHFGEKPEVNSYQDLSGFLNRLNADWVGAMKRMSPKVLLEFLQLTGKTYSALITALPPLETAMFAVAWAGDEQSPNWFHMAREYTERWHHQQQIRDATGREGIKTRELYHPFLDTCMRALPHAFRNSDAPDGTSVAFSITGEAGGDWYITKQRKWSLSEKTPDPAAHITMDGNVAWKFFTKSWRRKEIEPFTSITGDQKLGEVMYEMVAVM